jgi:hypothetical protein
VAGRLDQDRVGIQLQMCWEVAGTLSHHLGMCGRDRPGGQGGRRLLQRATEQGPGGADGAAGRPGAQAQPVAQPAGRRQRRLVLLGAGGPAGVDGGEFLEPEAGLAVQQPPPRLQPFDPDAVGEAMEVVGGKLVDRRGQLSQILRQLRRLGMLRRPGWLRRLRWLGRMCVRVHGHNLSTPPPNITINPKMWTTY